MITIDTELQNLIPALSNDEYQGLENSLLAEGCRDPIVLWNGIVVDGHNRYKICTQHDIEYKTIQREFASRDECKLWMIDNQFNRRNLPAFVKGELALKAKPVIAAIAKERQIRKPIDSVPLTRGEQTNKKDNETNAQIAKKAGVSHGTISKIEVILAKATPEVIQELREEKVSINKVHSNIVREEKREAIIDKLENIENKAIKELHGIYDVIVIDPPWDMKKIERDVRPNQSEFDYPVMTEQELINLTLPAADDCHVWCWTTHKHLPLALKLISEWGLKYVCTFVWHKNGGFQVVGLPQYNCEFAIYARKGNPVFIDLKDFNVCFSADRGAHSEKPECFYDVVRRVTAGRRVDMFNRRNIEGFDAWGNEAQ